MRKFAEKNPEWFGHFSSINIVFGDYLICYCKTYTEAKIRIFFAHCFLQSAFCCRAPVGWAANTRANNKRSEAKGRYLSIPCYGFTRIALLHVISCHFQQFAVMPTYTTRIFSNQCAPNCSTFGQDVMTLKTGR